jgi:hypothetical protein
VRRYWAPSGGVIEGDAAREGGREALGGEGGIRLEHPRGLDDGLGDGEGQLAGLLGGDRPYARRLVPDDPEGGELGAEHGEVDLDDGGDGVQGVPSFHVRARMRGWS